MAPLCHGDHARTENPRTGRESASRSSITGAETVQRSDREPNRTWTPVVIDDETPWVQGLSGSCGDTTLAIPSAGNGRQRAPAMSATARSGAAWDRPAAWAGLDKVPPTQTDEVVALQQRAGDLDR